MGVAPSLTTLQALNARNLRCNPVCIGESIWISTDYNDGERGLVEFHCPSSTIKHTANYPKGFTPIDHSMAGSTENGIVLVDGINGKLITFNTVSKEYGATVTIPNLGEGTSSLMIQGNVHIIHGGKNSTNRYLIYSIKTGKVTEFRDNLNSSPMNGVAITKCQDDSKFYKFGGKHVTSFYSGALQNGDAAKPIIWKKVPEFALKKVRNFATLQCGPFIMTFGGNYTRSGTDIHILNLQSMNGWIKSRTRSPTSGQCTAVLDQQYRVHLFSPNYHCSIAMNDLVPQFTAQDLDDKKVGDHGVSSSNLKDEVERLKKTNSNLTELQKGLESDNMRLKAENGRLKVVNESLREEVKVFKKTNADLIQKQKGLESDVMRLNAESKKLSDEVAAYQDEQKEAQRKIAELEDKVKELETKALDPSKFMEWDYNQIHFWIMGLENGRFKKHDTLLRAALSADEIIGEDLLDVTPLVLKVWGIKDRKESKGLNKQIQELVAQNQ